MDPRRLIFALIAFAPLTAFAQAARWVEFRPVRSVSIAGTLGDVESHLPLGHQYSDPDPVTGTHEGCHGIAASIRIRFNARNGYYLLHNRAFICPSPRLTLRQVAENVPVGKRGRVYRLYMQDAQRWWNDTAFYPCDELVAYLNGSVAGLELGLRERSLYSFDNALELWGYVRTSQRMARDSGYAHQAEFDAFIDQLHREKIHYLLVEYRKRGWR